MSEPSDGRTRPRYVEVGHELRERIENGVYALGQRLVGERQLAREFGVSPVTMSRALAELVRDGMIVRVSGAGTFVSSIGTVAPTAGQVRGVNEILVDTRPIDQPQANHYTGPVLNGLLEAATEHGFAVRFIGQSDGDRLASSHWRDGRGILYLAPYNSRHSEIEAQAQRCPVVACGVTWPGTRVATVGSDNAGAAAQVVRYLVRLGHREIVLVAPPGLYSDTLDRVTGYKQGLHAHGIELRADLVVETAGQAQFGDSAARYFDDLMLLRRAPTAVFVTGYPLALEAMLRLRSNGLHIPNDVSVVGFDDPISAAYLTPPLTTVRQPLKDIGRRAAALLLALIAHGASARRAEVLPCSLVVRSSCRSTRHEYSTLRI